MKKVLIALDYDPSAQKVAETGCAFAKAMGAEITLLHVISDPVNYSSPSFSPVMGFSGYPVYEFLQPDIITNLKKASVDFLEQTKKHLDDKTILTMVKEGEVAEAILEAANEIQADIIVTGSHSRNWLESILMGSESKKVLQHTPVPLLIVPTKIQN
jgi:nucleotide-binding universal stress UspA family protein